MATFTLQNVADSGSNSLRELIAEANTSIGPDVIKFNILVI